MVGSSLTLLWDLHGKEPCTYEYHISALLSLVRQVIIQEILSNFFRKSDFVTYFETIFMPLSKIDLTSEKRNQVNIKRTYFLEHVLGILWDIKNQFLHYLQCQTDKECRLSRQACSPLCLLRS